MRGCVALTCGCCVWWRGVRMQMCMCLQKHAHVYNLRDCAYSRIDGQCMQIMTRAHSGQSMGKQHGGGARQRCARMASAKARMAKSLARWQRLLEHSETLLLHDKRTDCTTESCARRASARRCGAQDTEGGDRACGTCHECASIARVIV